MACRTAMDEASSKKVTMMRCIDFSGEKEFSGAIDSICCRMVASDAGWKILGSERRVMRSVLDGGAGEESGGSEDRSSDKPDRDRFLDTEDVGGDEVVDVGGEGVRFVSMGDGCGLLGVAMMSCAVRGWEWERTVATSNI